MRRTLWLLDRKLDAKAWVALGFTSEQRGNASLDDVKKKFRSMMMELHPDANTSKTRTMTTSRGEEIQKVVQAKKHLEGRWADIERERETRAKLMRIRAQAPKITPVTSTAPPRAAKATPTATRSPRRPSVNAKDFGAAPVRRRESNPDSFSGGFAQAYTQASPGMDAPPCPEIRYDPTANPPPPPPSGGSGRERVPEESFFKTNKKSAPPPPPGGANATGAERAAPQGAGGVPPPPRGAQAAAPKDDTVDHERVQKMRENLRNFVEHKKKMELGEIFLGLTRHGDSLRR